MTKVVLVPLHYVNLFDSDTLRSIIKQYGPNTIGIEETQEDIDALLERSQAEHYILNVLDKLYEEASMFADNKTLIDIAKGEVDYYNILSDCKSEGIEIIGCDSNEFPNELYKGAIEEYNRSKKHFLQEISKLSPDAAKEKISESYNTILSISSSQDLLHRGLNLTTGSKLREYYEKRDVDTANRIRELAKDNYGTIMYFCNITHFNPTYPHLEFLLNDIKPEIAPIYESDNI